MLKHSLEVKKRDLKVKNKVYRREGLVVANLYGKGDSQALLIEQKALSKLLPQISESTVIYLHLEGGEADIPAMVYEVQKNVLTGEILHLSLRRVNLKQKVTAAIPIEVTGVFGVPEAVYLLVKDEVEAQALPTDLPEKFVVDLSQLTAIGQQITFADLTYDRRKIKLLLESDQEPIVVVDATKAEVEEEVVATEAEATATAAPAADGQGATAETKAEK